MVKNWQTTITIPHMAVGIFELMLGEGALAVSCVETSSGHMWIVAIITDFKPRQSQMERLAKTAAKIAGIEMPSVLIDPLQDQDWVKMSLDKLPPVRADRFYVYGHHGRGTTPAAAIGLEIDAGQAFGTGQHHTTRGCLVTLCQVNRQIKRRPRRILDIGTGTGVLAMAAAKLWHCPVVATDIDELSVMTATKNAKKNYVRRMRTILIASTRHYNVSKIGPYDVIIANILANPLIQIARDINRLTARGAFIILSGLLGTQANRVSAAYRAHGLVFQRAWDMGTGEINCDWQVLLFRKP